MSGRHWTESEINYLRDHYVSNPSEIAAHLGKSCKAVKNQAKRLCLEFGGRRQMRRIFDWLYTDSTHQTRLGRKYVKAMEVCYWS